MQVKNISPFGDLELTLLGRVVEAGEVFEVPDEDGARLIQQVNNWQQVDAEQPQQTNDEQGGESK